MVESLKELNEICQKPQYKEVGNWMVRKILRPLALPITWLLLHTPVTANQVTLAALLAGLWGIFLMALPGPGAFLAGALFLQLWYLLDHVDGQIARYRKTSGLTGRFYDFFMHHLIHGTVLFGLAFHAFGAAQNAGFLVAGFLASMAVIHFNLIHDIRCKAYVEHLGRGGRWEVLKAETGETAEVPAPQAGYFKRGFSLLHKSVEVHVIMNVLTAAALLEAFGLRIDLRLFLFLYYGMAAPVLAVVKTAYLIKTRKIDSDFDQSFRKIS